MNWLEQARRELAEPRREPKIPVVMSEMKAISAVKALAAETRVSAVLAVSRLADFKNLPADADSLAIDEAWQERAAIMQYDGGMDRDTADREALLLSMAQRATLTDA